MISVFWFLRNLRLHDNTALFHALKSGDKVQPAFIFDSNILSDLKNKKDKRVAFIHPSLQRIQEQLLSLASSLYILHKTPQKAFEQITTEFEVKSVFTNHCLARRKNRLPNCRCKHART